MTSKARKKVETDKGAKIAATEKEMDELKKLSSDLSYQSCDVSEVLTTCVRIFEDHNDDNGYDIQMRRGATRMLSVLQSWVEKRELADRLDNAICRLDVSNA